MNPLFQKTKTILFDFGGTIDSDGFAWKDRFYPLYKNADFKWSENEFCKYFYASDDYLNGKLKNVDFLGTIHQQVTLLLKNAGCYEKKIARQVADKFIKDSMKNIKRNLSLIRRLSKIYKLGIVSNFYGNLPYIFKQAGLDRYFGAIIDSSNLGVIKPDPKIFKAALRPLKSNPKESVFVGDNLFRDMGGAKAMGMKHIWIKHKGSKKKPCCKNDIVIRSFLELENILL